MQAKASRQGEAARACLEAGGAFGQNISNLIERHSSRPRDIRIRLPPREKLFAHGMDRPQTSSDSLLWLLGLPLSNNKERRLGIGNVVQGSRSEGRSANKGSRQQRRARSHQGLQALARQSPKSRRPAENMGAGRRKPILVC